jgi:hypothetical protein
MDSSVSAKDQILFLRVCNHFSDAIYNVLHEYSGAVVHRCSIIWIVWLCPIFELVPQRRNKTRKCKFDNWYVWCVCIVCVRCVCGVCEVCLWCVWCVSGVWVVCARVCVWCVCMCGVSVWWTHVNTNTPQGSPNISFQLYLDPQLHLLMRVKLYVVETLKSTPPFYELHTLLQHN